MAHTQAQADAKWNGHTSYDYRTGKMGDGTPAPVLGADSLYLGDNGRCFCGQHAGHTAKYSGRDLSGQPVLRLDARVVKQLGFDISTFKCEQCGKGLALVALR